jgi:hypothetical protein
MDYELQEALKGHINGFRTLIIIDTELVKKQAEAEALISQIHVLCQLYVSASIKYTAEVQKDGGETQQAK